MDKNNNLNWNELVAQSKQRITKPQKSQSHESWGESVKHSKQYWNCSTIISRIDRMTGAQFEEFMASYFRDKGYSVIKTKLSGDFGIDLIIENKFFRCGVQLKRYSKKVSLKAVQEVIGGLEHYKLNQGMVITNNYFQLSAITLAGESSKPITLWNRDILIQKLEK